LSSCVLVSTRLFPRDLLERVAEQFSDQLRRELRAAGDDVVRMELIDPLQEAESQVIALFKRKLTEAALQDRATTPNLPCEPTRPQRKPGMVTMLFTNEEISCQFRRLDGRVQALLTIGCDQVEWHHLLDVLARLTNVIVTFDSLWPVDRYVVLLDMEPGARPDQVAQQVLAELFATE
jgi:hypothetical protein